MVLPLIYVDEKTEALSRRSPETSNGSIVFDFTGGGGGRNTAANKSDESGGKSVQTSPSRSKRINGGGEAEPHVAEGDYLVFCFREDGAIDIIGGGDDEDENVSISKLAV